MQTFLAIVVVSVLAMLASSSHGFRLRRSRLTAALVSGGWFAVAAGAAIGPHALGAVTPETLRAVTPLVVLGLGWIGLMVGLQASRGVLAGLPGWVVRPAAADLALTVVCFGVVGWFGVEAWQPGSEERGLYAALIACASLGWAMETRSLAGGDESARGSATMVIRGAGGLAALAAVGVFGVNFALTHRTLGTELAPGALGAARLVVAGALGLAAGLIARFALREALGSRGSSLAVILGLVALVGGLAYELDLSPLFVAGVTGAVMANLAGTELRSFERVILRAEHAIAAVFAMLAGVLLDPAIGWKGVGLAAVIAGARLVVKPAGLRWGSTGSGPALGALSFAAVRQSPLAIAMAVSVVTATVEPVAQKLLTVLVLAGLMAELTPMAAMWAMRGKPMATPVESAETGTPDVAESGGSA